MFRKIWFLPLLLPLITACTAIPFRSSQQQGNAEPIRLTLLISGDPTDEAAYRALIDAFAATPAALDGDVTVDLINIPSSGDFNKRLTADFAAGAPPDIFLINYRRYAAYAAKGAIEPLTDYLANSATIDLDDYYPQALAAFTWQDTLYCMPQNLSSPLIYYNKALFDAAGVAYPNDAWTWDEFLATAQALTQDGDENEDENEDEDGGDATDIYGFGSEASLVRMAPFVWMNGGELVDDPAAPTRLTLDSPASREALAWFIALQTTHKVTPDAVAEAAESSESRFLNGRLAMFIDSRRAVPEFRTIDNFDWDVAALPVGKQRASILHSDAWCMAAASKQKSAAWAFIEFANSTAGQTILAQTGRTVPSLRALAESTVFLDPQARPANSQAFLNAIPHIRSLPVMATWSDIENVVSAELQSAFDGVTSLDEAIEAAERRSAEFFAR